MVSFFGYNLTKFDNECCNWHKLKSTVTEIQIPSLTAMRHKFVYMNENKIIVKPSKIQAIKCIPNINLLNVFQIPRMLCTLHICCKKMKNRNSLRSFWLIFFFGSDTKILNVCIEFSLHLPVADPFLNTKFHKNLLLFSFYTVHSRVEVCMRWYTVVR